MNASDPVTVRPSPRVRVGQTPAAEKQAKIRLKKEGDVVVAMEVTCACGETILIDCKYENLADTA